MILGKKHIFIVVGLLGFLVFADKFWGRFDTSKRDQEVDTYIEQNDSIINMVDVQLDSLRTLSNNDQMAIDSLNELLVNNTSNKKETDRLKALIKEYETNKNRYDEQIFNMGIEPLPMSRRPLQMDSTVVSYNYIERDTVVYRKIRKDTLIYLRDTIVMIDTIFMTDTIQVDEKYIKNKFYRDME